MRRIRKVMLAVPSCTWFNPRHWIIPPYTLGILLAVIPEEFEVAVLDANMEELSFEETARRIADFGPDLVGITGMSLEFARAAHKMAELVKGVDRDIVTVMGGVYATTSTELALADENVDFLILGEGEVRLPRFLKLLNEGRADLSSLDGLAYRRGSKSVIQPMNSIIEDLDSIPLPAYGCLDYQAYINKTNKFGNVLLARYFPYATTMTSRGCPFHCIYCSTHSIDGRKIRFKSAERVLEEIDWLVRDYGVKEMIFLDDNLIYDRERIVRIMEGLIARNYDLHWKSVNLATFLLDDELLEMMKASGVYQVILPVESGNPHVLKNILKKPLKLEKALQVARKARELGLETSADFIIGIPGETWDQMRDTFRFAEEMDVDMVSFHVATPLPQTELYQIAKDKGYLPPDFDFWKYQFFGFGRGVITTEEFRPQDVHMLRALEWDRINFATPQKRERFAGMSGITQQDLAAWRRKTIQNLGLYWPEARDKAVVETLDRARAAENAERE